MMKNIFCFIAISTLLLTGSCKREFLQRDPGVPISGEDVFTDPVLAARFADNSFTFQLDDYGRMSQGYKGTTGQFSDEAVASAASDSYPFVAVMTLGNYLDPIASDVVGVYNRMYQGIRNVNVMLSKVDSVPWTAVQNGKLIKAQMLYLRGMFYWELVKRFGGVILADKPFSLNDNIDLPRNTYQETVNFILKDLADAEQIFSTETFGSTYTPTQDWDARNYGRPTIGAVRALRSRLLLFDASPVNNPTNDAARWQKAADAAKQIIDMGKYSLHADYKTLLNQASSPEYILIKIRGPRSFGGILSDFIVPPSSGGAQGLLNPTQNHVDLYEMSNGKPITDATSGYNPQDPYKNRDPRFYANLIYNDMTWQNRKIQMYDGGTDYQPASNSTTRTRYYCRKLWPEIYRGGSTATTLMNFIFFRYGETLMNYAEALNEAQGPVADVHKYVNMVRKRAGMPDLPLTLTREQMRERIQNERGVEFAFEELRWWDLRRWKRKDIILNTVKAMDVVKTGTGFTYTVVPLAATYQRVFEDKMYLYPIPRAEINKSNGILKQNPGWE